MTRFLFFLTLGLLPGLLHAEEDEAPPISITSPDQAVTFVYGTQKEHALIWNKKEQALYARITFTDQRQSNGQSSEDTHSFRLPGVSFDATRKIFTATSAKGEIIPVARIKKAFLFETIQALPNARVRVLQLRANVTVILEAIRPDDPAMHPAPSNPDGSHSVDLNKIVQ